jgi:hypothetical protein
MKTYLSVGIGDFFCLDSLLTKEEKENISEIYWACRFGKEIGDILFENSDYPNFKKSYIIPDDVGRNLMKMVEPNAENFWHFRPDFPGRKELFLRYAGVSENELNIIDAVGIFKDQNRKFIKSSMFLNCDKFKINELEKDSYILVHYPTSTRPILDQAVFTEEDWKNIEDFAKKHNKKVVVVTDTKLNLESYNFIILYKFDIRYYPSLVKNCFYFLGCDSFLAVLATRIHTQDKISIKAGKTHMPDINHFINDVWSSKYFLPYSPEIVSTFLKHSLEYKL